MILIRCTSSTFKQAARKLTGIIKLQRIKNMAEAVSSLLPGFVTPTTNSNGAVSGDKRQCEEEAGNPVKKQKTEDLSETAAEKVNRKKVVMLLVYCGKGYLGMQRNPGAKTIESDLMEALLKAQLASKEHIDNPSRKMYFQRAARTDKGVSAAGQICSLMMDVNIQNPVEKINKHLVEQIRIIALQRVTKRFDSKNAASARTYQYLLPTYAFTPCEEFVLQKYRITDEAFEKVNNTLALFKGTKNFHNFTSGKKPSDPSAKRYIMEFSMGSPFVRKEVQFALISVKGQSFMLHQIRKMIGLTIAIVRGLAGTDAVEKAYGSDKCDIPKAPGLGLMLDRVHYDYYNKRFGDDGMHEPILWEKYESEINRFKEDYIYPTIIDTEIEERSMMKWLATLHLHHFDICKSPEDYGTPLIGVYSQLKQLAKEKELHSDSSADCEDVQPSMQSPDHGHKEGTVADCTSHTENSNPEPEVLDRPPSPSVTDGQSSKTSDTGTSYRPVKPDCATNKPPVGSEPTQDCDKFPVLESARIGENADTQADPSTPNQSTS